MDRRGSGWFGSSVVAAERLARSRGTLGAPSGRHRLTALRAAHRIVLGRRSVRGLGVAELPFCQRRGTDTDHTKTRPRDARDKTTPLSPGSHRLFQQALDVGQQLSREPITPERPVTKGIAGAKFASRPSNGRFCSVRRPQTSWPWEVIFSPPQLGHLTFALARSARVSATSKPFSHLAHTNPCIGVGSPTRSAQPVLD